MSLIMRNDKNVVEFIAALKELLDTIESALKNRKPVLNGEHFLTDKELSEKLKVSRRTLQEYRDQGIIPYIELGGKMLYRSSDLEKLLNDNYRQALSD